MTALVFASFQFYRRFWLACLILFFTRTPIFQVITVLILNTSFLAALLHEQMLRSRLAYVREVVNEALVFVTTYLLLCYTEYFVLDAGTRNDFGQSLIWMTISIFAINFIAILIFVCQWCKKRKAKKRA